MGVTLPVGFGIFKLRWKILTAPDEMISTCGYVNGGATTAQQDADAIYGYVAAAGCPGNQAHNSTKYQFVGVSTTLQTISGPHLGEHVNRVTGSGTGTPCTTNTSLLVKKVTARGGRHGRGRFFVPCSDVSDIDVDENGIIGTSQVTALQLSWTTFFNSLNGSSTPAVLLHSDGSTPDSITAFQVENIVATQRRRLRR